MSPFCHELKSTFKQIIFMRTPNLSSIILGGLLLTGTIACHKEKLPKPLTASFQIKEVIWDNARFPKETYDTDSVSTPEVEFLANQPEDSSIGYQWHIGTDSRTFSQQGFTLNFPAGTDNIEINLTIQKKDATGNLVETKSQTRTIYFRESQVEGHFQGYFEGFSQKTDVYIKQNVVSTLLYGSKGILITSGIAKFDSLYSPNDWHEHLVLNRVIYFDWASTTTEGLNTRIQFPNGSISLSKDYKTVTIDLTVTEVSTGRKIPMKFEGTRIL
jgi:hypothetical protein